MSSCPAGWTRQGEFLSLEQCDIPIIAIQLFEAGLFLILFTFALLMILRLVDFFRTPRPTPASILVVWNLLHIPLMSIRGILNYLDIQSENSLWANLALNFAAASATGMMIFYMYLELTVIIKGSLETRDSSLTSAKWIMGSMAGVKTALFAAIPIIFHLGNFPYHYLGFWLLAIVVDLVIITYFLILGLILHRKLRQTTLPGAIVAARKLLRFVISCTVMGIISGIAGIIAITNPNWGWVLIRVCWVSAAISVIQTFWSLTPPNPRKFSRPNTSDQLA